MSTRQLLILNVPGVPGDVPATGYLELIDNAGQSRNFWEYGIEELYGNVDTPLQLNAASLTTSGFAGASTAGTGSVNANVIRATLTSTPVVACSTGSQPHVGAYRVWAHVKPSSASVQARLAWQEGSGAFNVNSFVVPADTAAFCDVDLGVVNIPPPPSGSTQQWVGRVEALGAVGDTIDVDYLLLIPVSAGYAKALAPSRFETVTAYSARDSFSQAAGALNGKPLDAGGTWATSGVATDFQVDSTHVLTRTSGSEASPRFALAGTTVFTDALVQADVSLPGVPASAGLLVRYVDASNFMWVSLGMPVSTFGVLAYKVVGGVYTILRGVVVAGQEWNTVRLVVTAAGRWSVWSGAKGSVGSLVLSGTDTALATGGVLASGKSGLADFNGTFGAVTTTRSYDNFIAAVPTVDAALFSGRLAQARRDGSVRQDSAGTYYGPVPSARPAARFRVPCAGSSGRTMRIAVRATRSNPEQTASPDVNDALTARVVLVPRYLVPR